MKKRLVCILLCMAMLITGAAFTGCDAIGGNGSETTGEGEVSKLDRSSMTLTLWVPTKEGTTEEAIYAVEEAINQITQPEYDTAIKLYAVPDSEYEKTVKERIQLIEKRINQEEQDAIDRRKQEIEAAKRGETLVEGTTAYVNPNMDGDLSLVVRGATGYTNVERNQMDIFLIRGAEDYQYYIDNYYVQSLNEDLNGSCKVLGSYIFPDFISAANEGGSVYAIPNNHEVGKYTYFLVNKRLVEAEYLDPARLTNLSDCQSFIEDVAAYYPGVTPVYGTYDPSYYQYYSAKDDCRFSVLASRVTPNLQYENLTVDNIFGFTNFTNNYYLYKKLVEKGFVSTEEVAEFGVGYVTGTASEVKEKYGDDYYLNVFKQPEGKKDDYMQSMFAVSSYSKSVSRSMEIITMINTNTELRTILQYGAQGVHWKYDEENSDVIVKLSDEYQMNLIDTGNVYMTYPDYGVGLDYWDDIKAQNLDSYLPLTYSFDYRNEDNAALLAALDSFSAEIWNEIQGMSADEFRASVSRLKSRVDANDAYQKLKYIPSDGDASRGKTEEKGWKADASIANQLAEIIAEATGETK